METIYHVECDDFIVKIPIGGHVISHISQHNDVFSQCEQRVN